MKTKRDIAEDVLIGVRGLPHPSDPNYRVLVMAIQDAIEAAERDATNDTVDAAIRPFRDFGGNYWTRDEIIQVLDGLHV